MSDTLDRITYALLRPAARQALRGGVALRELKHKVELAYYHEARRRGLKMREISEQLAISMSKVGALSKQLKDHFRQPELEHGLQRQILSLLWAVPLTESRIAGALPEFEPEEVSAALAALVEHGGLEVITGRTDRYRLTAQAYRMTTDPWLARLDGLNTLLEHVELAVQTRLVEGDPRAMVRNVYFNARPEDLGRLQQLYEEQLFPLIIALDAQAQDDPQAVPIRLSVLWAPDEASQPEDEDEDDS